MAKKQLITITSFKDAIPKKGIWYSYYDDIFVSVICIDGRRSHLRNKNSDKSKRKDAIMSEWHTNWQYNQIENFHGKAVGKEKTYEISIYQNGERHIIDSVVEKVAIEFQHTLSVAVSELDSRWDAHEEYGYIPYLVLDFTKYNMPVFFEKGFIFSSNSIKRFVTSKNENDLKVISKIKKWTSSKHFLNGNLFLEFNDRIIRFHKELSLGFLTLGRAAFVNDILSLELQLSNQIKADILAKKEEIKEQARKESEQRRLEDQKREQRIKQLEIDKKENLRLNNIAKRTHPNYNYFRKIFNNIDIKKNLSLFDFNQSIISYEHLNERGSTSHIYFSEDFNLMLIYNYKFDFNLESKTLIQPKPPEMQIIRRVGNEIKTFTYGATSSKVKEKRVEIAKGYLHSFKDAALIEYDEKANRKKKSFYIHNQEIDEDLFQHASRLHDEDAYWNIHQPTSNLSNDQSTRLQSFEEKIADDKYHFQLNIVNGRGIYKECLENYYKENEIVFHSKLKNDFYIYDQS